MIKIKITIKIYTTENWNLFVQLQSLYQEGTTTYQWFSLIYIY